MHTAKILLCSLSLIFHQVFRLPSNLFHNQPEPICGTSLLLKAFSPSSSPGAWVVQHMHHRTASHLMENSTKRITLSALRRNNRFVFLLSPLPLVRLYHGDCWSNYQTELTQSQLYVHLLKREKLTSFKLWSSFFHITAVLEIHTFACFITE